MKIDNGVEMLELSMNMGGVQRSIYPVILWDDNTLILVDSGFPGQMEEIREKMDNANITFEKLDIVIVTHQDIDHWRPA